MTKEINIEDNHGQINIIKGDHAVIIQKIVNSPNQPNGDSEGVIIHQNPSGFQPCHPLFHQGIQTIQLSLQHSLEHLLILADRVLMYSQYDIDKKELRKLPKHLKQLQESGLEKLSSNIVSFLSIAIRQWLDTLHQCLFPEKWKQNKRKPDETQIWLDLDLPSIKESSVLLQKDFTPQNLFKNTDSANYLKRWLTSIFPTGKHPNYFKQWLAAFVFPLDKHYYLLRKVLRSIVLHKQPEKKRPHLEIIKEERQFHLKKYVDRPDPLQEVFEQLKNTKGTYLLITGKAGIGKTAFCSKLSEELARPSNHFDPFLPWLPNIILHYCKKLKTPKEIIETWLIQANRLLINQLSFPHFHLEHQKNHNLIREALYQILHQLTVECGEIIFIIDALDELSIPLEDLEFLPKLLPDEAKVIISVRKGSPTENWLIANRQMTIFELGPLKREEIPLFTKLDDKIEKEFHDKLWNFSQGWTLYVSTKVQELFNKRGNTAEIELTHIDHFYNDELKKWDLPSGEKTLQEILGLLAIFEAASSLSLEEIQSYLRSRQMDLNKLQLKSLLSHVGDHVSGIQSDSVILQINSFAQYIREQCWSKHDYNKELSKIIHWLGTDSDLPIKTISRFVLAYSSEKQHLMQLINHLEKNNPDRTLQVGMYIYLFLGGGMSQSTIHFIDNPAKQGNLKAMHLMTLLPLEYSYANVKWEEELNIKLKKENTTLEKIFQDDPILNAYFKEKHQLDKGVEELKHSSLFISFANELFKWFRYDEAIYWLRKAAEQHHSDAMTKLAYLLIYRGKTKKQIQEGYYWLQKAAESGWTPAMLLLGCCLIEGDYLSQNVEEGEKWLRKAAESGEKRSMTFLGNYLIEGKYLSQNIKEGELWLRKAADLGDIWGMASLGQLLISTLNVEEGLAWLDQAINQADIDRYNINNHPPLNEEGKQWLHKAANNGDPIAMHKLSLYLINGKYLSQNIKEGEKWLRKAADLGNTDAMVDLGICLINGKYLSQNTEEGERWLRKAADLGNTNAICQLGVSLILGYSLPQDIEEGELWLRKAADLGNTLAMTFLGKHLIEGEYLSQNLKEGEFWLRKAAENEDIYAMYCLGDYLIEGDFLSQDVQQGEYWLRKAAKTGNIKAMYWLGFNLILGKRLSKNVQEGEYWIQKVQKHFMTFGI